MKIKDDRRLQRMEFCKLHEDLFKEATSDPYIKGYTFLDKTPYYTHKSIPARKIVLLSRKEFKHSLKYNDCDIFNSIMGLYRDMVKNKLL